MVMRQVCALFLFGFITVGLVGCRTRTNIESRESIAVIDTHIHLYDTTRAEGVDWPPPADTVLYRPVLPPDFDSVCASNRVYSSVIVEASGRVEDNQWILDLVAHNPERYAAVIGSLPVGSDEFAPALERFSADPRYKGIRLRARPDGDAFFENDAVWRDLKLLAEKGLVLDVLLANFSLADVALIASRVPDLKIMVNHLTGLEINGEAVDPEWVNEVKKVAVSPNVYCKVSGIFQRSGQSPAPKELAYYAPVFEVIYEVFGEDRIVYGSNWPVTMRGGTYAEQFKVIDTFFTRKGEEVRRKLYQTNAQRFYSLTND